MPEYQADEKELRLLHNTIENTVKNSCDFTYITTHEFVQLRNSVCVLRQPYLMQEESK